MPNASHIINLTMDRSLWHEIINNLESAGSHVSVYFGKSEIIKIIINHVINDALVIRDSLQNAVQPPCPRIMF